MARPLEGTAALVTGASSGIGAATARALAAQGAAVALVARRRERLERLAAEMKSRALVLQADVTDRTQAADAVERAVAGFGRLDILVDNAGIMLLGPAVGAPLEEWEQMVAVNVNGFLYVAHAALPHLVEAAQRGPRQVADFVAVSSVAGRKAGAGAAVYCLTKFGVRAFSDSVREELASRHVRVSVIEPGAVNTELFTHLRPGVRTQTAAHLQIERLEPEDVADAIAYIVTRARRIALNEALIRPAEQER